MAHALNRRTAIVGLTSAGALLAVTDIGKSAFHPDADLFAIARQVKAQQAEADTAYNEYSAIKDAFVPPPPPQELLVRPDDDKLLALDREDESFPERIGQKFNSRELSRAHTAGLMGSVLVVASPKDTYLHSRGETALDRSVEIMKAAEAYRADEQAARNAAGQPQAWVKWNALEERASKARAELALFPARTIEGVLAKLDAVADSIEVISPEDIADGCEVSDMVYVAAAELLRLRKPVEA